MYTTTSVISSYLVQSTCEVADDQCLCISISVISDYTIAGSTPDFSKAGGLTHLPLVPQICASVLDPGNGSAWIQVWLAATYLRRQAITQTHPNLLPIVIDRFQTPQMPETVINRFKTRTRWRSVKTLGQHQVGVNLQSHSQHQLWISTWHIFHEFHKIMPG